MSLRKLTSFTLHVILVLAVLKESTTTTECEREGTSTNLPVVSMCFDESVESNALLLDTYRAKEATNTNPCVCTATVSAPTNITISKRIQPGFQGCGNNVVITSATYSASLNCFAIASPMQLHPGTGATFSLTKPIYTWDHRFCIQLTAVGNIDAEINMTCYENATSVIIPYTTTTPGSTTTASETTVLTEATTVSSLTETATNTTTIVPTETSSSQNETTSTEQTSVNNGNNTTEKIPETGNQKPKENEAAIPWNLIIPLVATAAIMLIICVASCFIHYDRKKSVPYEVAKKEGENLVLRKYDNHGYQEENEISEVTLTPEQISSEKEDNEISKTTANGHVHNVANGNAHGYDNVVNGNAHGYDSSMTNGNAPSDSPQLYADMNGLSSSPSDVSEKSSKL